MITQSNVQLTTGTAPYTLSVSPQQQPTPQTLLEGYVEKLSNVCTTLAELETRLCAVTDRLLGAHPRPVSDGATGASPSICEQLGARIDAVISRTVALHGIADRLQSL